MDTTVKLECWAYGDAFDTTFSVKISTLGTWSALQQAIKDVIPSRFNDMNVPDLQLYPISISRGDDRPGFIEDRLKEFSLKEKRCIHWRSIIHDLISESHEGRLLIVVIAPSSGSSACLLSIRCPSDNKFCYPDSHTREVSSDVPEFILNCWVCGQQLTCTFGVQISITKTISFLQKVIKTEKLVDFGEVDADCLALYKVSIAYSDNHTLKSILSPCTISSLGESLPTWQQLSTVFMPLPPKNQLHLVIGMLQ